jgi:trehalose 6-phosphate phosphatase
MLSREQINERLDHVERLWLFLDYDGTLADFAPTPDQVAPQPDVVGLVARLAQHPRLFVAVVSGRRLSHVRALIPVPGVLLAGTYGIELQLPNGKRMDRIEFERIRPTLDAVKPRWEELIAGLDGFFLEDKSWALALHARFAADDESEQVLAAARRIAADALESGPTEEFRLLGGHKFLEIGPRLAHKGRTIDYLLDRYPISQAIPLYLGDDDKDEEAFDVVHAHGGIAILVAPGARSTQADYRLASPRAARRWLEELMVHLETREPAAESR